MTQAQARTSVVTVKELLEAGVHFGHQTRRWNPKMRRFIYGERNGIYIIDVQATLKGIEDAYTFVRDLVADGGTIMFVSTKRQMADIVKEYAERCGMPYVNYRWLGGMLTNFQTIHGRINYLHRLEELEEGGELDAMKKKEALRLRRERVKLERYLGGMRDLTEAPDAVWIIDTRKEQIAVREAQKRGIPVVAALDTNCDPDEVDYGIPGNDDAIRSGELLSRIIADAVDEGKEIFAKRGSQSRRRAKRDEAEAEILRQQAAADAKAYEEERAKQEASEAARVARLEAEAAKAAEAAEAEATPTDTAADAPPAAAEADEPTAEAEATEPAMPDDTQSESAAEAASGAEDQAPTTSDEAGAENESEDAPEAIPTEEEA